ncbi:MAG: hypothetical protein CBC57_05905 [Euryarchaeota archaeon TMED97]|nr:MAG: hypothetical protein CBC57_05905 [Euryarchaeota archaeon TMED97]|tara:strand:+ start:4081 stop:4671 length:591 start_codon:yes stop_codon:yes gene_type:complete
MIIGICGLIGSGKGTVADILVENHNFEKLSFADKLKDGVASVFDWDRDMLEGDTDRSRIWREKADVFWSSETGKEITPRLVLQLFGTDCMRNGFFDGIWVSLVKQKILENPNKNWVIPDVRFPNEVKMIQSVQGQVWQVRRGDLPVWFMDKRDNGVEPTNVHASEWAWIDQDESFNEIIQNDDSLEELLKKIEIIV